MAVWFEEAADGTKNPKRSANIILTELLAKLNEDKKKINDVAKTTNQSAEIVNAIE